MIYKEKQIFVTRLKDSIVDTFATNKQKSAYFKKRECGDTPDLPPHCKTKFIALINDRLEKPTDKKNKDAGGRVNKWLNPFVSNMPYYDTLKIICDGLHVSSDYLLGLSDRKESYDDIYISEKMGLVPETITRIKGYDEPLKFLLNGLVDCNVFEEMNKDLLHYLLVAFYDYGMSAYDTSITTKDIFGNESVINDKEKSREMLKYPANNIFNFCLDTSPFILKEERAGIYDLKDQLARAREKELETELQKYEI